MRGIRLVMLLVLVSVIASIIIAVLPGRAKEYGPFPLPDTERITALEKALKDHGAALEKHENEFHFYWKLDKTKRGE